MTITAVEILIGPVLMPANRPDSPARWELALARAHLGVELFRTSDGFYASSQRDPGTVYEVTATTCGCEAARNGDPVCSHRAAVRSALWVEPFGRLLVR